MLCTAVMAQEVPAEAQEETKTAKAEAKPAVDEAIKKKSKRSSSR
jgi:hypothetical protein